MRKLQKNRHFLHAFTLIELLTVTTIIGILASVATPLFTKYIRKSKTTEAYTNLRKIYDGEVSYYIEDRVDAGGIELPKRFVETSVQPEFPPTADKRTGDFEADNWSLIKFQPDSEVYYVYFADAYPFANPYPLRPVGYDITNDPPGSITIGMQAAVMGDLDGDGNYSFFSRTYGVKPDGSEEVGGGIFALDRIE